MTILNRYLGRIFFAKFALLLASLSALVVILDFLATADEVIASSGGDTMALFRYAGLRLPQITSELIPFCVLLAVLITLAGLLRNNELVSLRAAGFSQFKLLTALVPLALVVGVLHFAIEDVAVPAATRALHDWGVGEYGRGSEEGKKKTWLRDGSSVISIGGVDMEKQTLSDITIFRRDESGGVIEHITAASARYEQPDWILYQVQRLVIGGGKAEHLERLTWQGRLRPAFFAVVSIHPKELPFRDIKRFVDDPGFGNRPHYFYLTWLHKKIALPLSSVLMVLLAIPLAQRFQRTGGMTSMMVIGITIGFIYFVFDGWTLTVGEAGLIPPIAAAWGPLGTFALVAAAIAVQFERR